MSSYLIVISAEEPIPPGITGLDLVLWTLEKTDVSSIGYSSIDIVHLNLFELPYSLYKVFKDTISKLTKSEFRGSRMLIPNDVMKSLWNDNTLLIKHQRLGSFNKEQWIEFCDSGVLFSIYIE